MSFKSIKSYVLTKNIKSNILLSMAEKCVCTKPIQLLIANLQFQEHIKYKMPHQTESVTLINPGKIQIPTAFLSVKMQGCDTYQKNPFNEKMLKQYFCQRALQIHTNEMSVSR